MSLRATAVKLLKFLWCHQGCGAVAMGVGDGVRNDADGRHQKTKKDNMITWMGLINLKKNLIIDSVNNVHFFLKSIRFFRFFNH